MSPIETITSRTNPLSALVRRLERERSFRREQRLFLGDGVKLYEEARKAGCLDTVLFTPGRQPQLPQGVRAVQVPEHLMDALSPAKTPQGVLFLCAMPDLTLPRQLSPGRYLVLDGLQDPGNVGTIWRTADAFGASGLILTHACADPYSPKTVRASMGAVFRLPVWEAAPAEIAACLQRSGIPLYGTALREDTVDLRSHSGGSAAVVIGSEGSGISDEMLSLCSQTWKIPMEAKCESLNAAVAASVVLWELYRQEV